MCEFHIQAVFVYSAHSYALQPRLVCSVVVFRFHRRLWISETLLKSDCFDMQRVITYRILRTVEANRGVIAIPVCRLTLGSFFYVNPRPLNNFS